MNTDIKEYTFYKIVDAITGVVLYVGQTIDFNRRMGRHTRNIEQYETILGKYIVDNDINDYIMTTLKVMRLTQTDADDQERLLTDQLKPVCARTTGGKSGYTVSRETTLLRSGENSMTAKLSEDDVIAIRKDARTATEIADSYIISADNVHLIKNYKAWTHIPPTPDDVPSADATVRGTDKPSAKLNEDKVRAIRKDPRSQQKIADQYGVARSTISDIKNYKKWKHVKN